MVSMKQTTTFRNSVLADGYAVVDNVLTVGVWNVGIVSSDLIATGTLGARRPLRRREAVASS